MREIGKTKQIGEKMNIETKIFDILSSLQKDLSVWLEEQFIALNEESWWDEFVYPVLSYQQTQLVNRNNINSLQKLDLAALLRIFDKNWYFVTKNSSIDGGERNYVKSLQQIRNKFAHLANDSLSNNETLECINTISNFTKIISCQNKYNKALQELKNKPKDYEVAQVADIEMSASQEGASDEIVVGSMICLKRDKKITGAVINISGKDDKIFTVFMNNEAKEFYLNQIELVSDEIKTVSVKKLHSILTALQINHPSTSDLYSLNAARIDFVPYQFRPVLKIIQSDQPRILIADSVGVGKTIEAGLILRELQSRNDIQSVLIICPKPLVAEKKWYNEMKRFDEKFTQFDGKKLRNCIAETDSEGEWDEPYSIIPYSLFDEDLLHGKTGRRKQLGLLDLEPAPKFDLVIVDEAHNIRNSNTFRYNAVKFFCDNAEAVVFLTATPIQLGNNDLYTLLNLLRPDIVIDKDSFDFMSEPNPFINKAAKYARSNQLDWKFKAQQELELAENTPYWKSLSHINPDFIEIKDLLNKRSIGREKRVELIQKLEQLHSFSNIINRTRRRDIDNFCIRKPITRKIQFTEEQEKLYIAIISYQETLFAKKYPPNTINFIMSNIRRRVASSVHALKPYLDKKFDADLENIDEEEDITATDEMFELATDLIDIADNLSEYDPKFDELDKIIQAKQEMENSKLIVFSSFRYTLFYLQKLLKEKGIRVGLIYGDVCDEDRQDLRARFEMDKTDEDALDVMLFSEVGCEGLDYQFCDTMVNYDLPWNPMKIEQRIGRIDRRGQQSESVVIYNLITEKTIEEDIYDRCLNRIGVFESSIGECEEILGEIHKGIKSIVDDFALTDSDKQSKLAQLADNEIRNIQEEQKLEEQQHELFGLSTQGFKNEQDVQNADNYWISPTALSHLVISYLNDVLGTGDYIKGYKDLKNLRLSKEKKQILLTELTNSKDKSEVLKFWKKWLKSDEQNCQITFNSSCASKERKAQFIMPLHPLVKQASKYFDRSEIIYSILKIQDDSYTAGEYYFAIYQMDIKGLNSEIKLVPICEDEEIQNNLFDILEICTNANCADYSIKNEDFEDLKILYKKVWEQKISEHKAKTKKSCTYRKASLDKSNQARKDILISRLECEYNEKILKMKKGELNNIESNYNDKVAKIQNAINNADIDSKPVVFGMLKVEN